jgi:adenylate cyclase
VCESCEVFFHRRGQHRLHTALFLAIGLGVTGFAVLSYGLHWFERLELSTVDKRFAIRGDLPPPKTVAVVGIDDISFNELNRRWQDWPRRWYGTVIRNLARAGAKGVAMDVQFTEPTTPQFGCGERCQGLADEEDYNLITAVGAVRKRSPVTLSTTEVTPQGHTRVFGGDSVVRQYGGRVGNGNQITDSDGTIRRFAYEIAKLKTFSVVAAERALGHAVRPDSFPHNRAWVDYSGPPGAVPSISYSHVLRNQFDPRLVRGRVVVVGAVAPTLGDVHATSTSGTKVTSGPEIQASEIDTVLRGFPLRDAPGWLNFLVICVLGLVPPILGLRLSAVWTVLTSAAFGVLYAFGTQFAFDHGRVLAFIYPVGALALSTVGALGAHYVLAAFERQRTRDTFSRFVPETVVNQVLAQTDEGLRLGGVRVVGTCMFTDLRGSTKFAESLPPETVVTVINRYLGELTEAILGHGGTLISYLGDGFMAVFGAPIDQPDHADRALAAAREILGHRLPLFNEWFREQGFGDGFRIGVGLNSGPFMAGNVGSEKRLEYTAMGDTINTASRLEGLTKESDFYMLMAESTREALVDAPDDLVQVGAVDVRGREGQITVWSVEEARKPEAAAAPDTAPAPAAV